MNSENTLNKPNQLISILPEKSISLIQQKSYNIFLKKAQNKVKFSDEFNQIDKDKRYSFKISFKELKEKAGLDKNDYEYIKSELEKLMKIVISVVDKEDKEDWDMFHLLEKVKKRSNTFEFFLDGFIVKALKEHNFFTSLDLMQLKKLKSKYSVAFYELAIRYKKYKIPKMSIEELRKRTSTQDKYKRFYDFKKYVLDKACEEINEKTDIRLSYETEKVGRKIAYIDFEIEKKEKEIDSKTEEKQDQEVNEYSEQVLELFNLLPEIEQIPSNKEVLHELLSNYEFKYIKADIEYAKEFEPKNFIGFLKSSCERGHFGKVKLEKKEKEEELTEKHKKSKQKEEELKQELEEEAKNKAIKEYKNLNGEELEEYLKGYDTMCSLVSEDKQPTKEEYVIGSLQKKFEAELKQEYLT